MYSTYPTISKSGAPAAVMVGAAPTFDELVTTLRLIEHATAPTQDDGAYHEAAHDLASGVLKRIALAAQAPAEVALTNEQIAEHLPAPAYHDGFGRSPDLWTLAQIGEGVRAALAAYKAQPKEMGSEADWYHVECDDPDYSQFVDNLADAQTLVSEHGGKIEALYAGPLSTDVARVAHISRTLCELVRVLPIPRTKQAQAPYEAALLLASQIENQSDYSITLPALEVQAPAPAHPHLTPRLVAVLKEGLRDGWQDEHGAPLKGDLEIALGLRTAPCAAVVDGPTDAERLDYLQQLGATVHLIPAGHDGNGQMLHSFCIGGLHRAVSRDIREAIDAAISLVPVHGLGTLEGWQLVGARSPEEYEEFRRWVAAGKPPVQAVAAEPVAIHPVAKRRVLDAIRGAYDLGYNDARSARTVPGDSAPGYKGRDVEADHGGALIHSLETGPRASSSAANGLEPMSDDTKRMDWLAKRLLGADWAYGEPATCVWLIETDAGISADLRASIDAAMQSGTGGEKSNG